MFSFAFHCIPVPYTSCVCVLFQFPKMCGDEKHEIKLVWANKQIRSDMTGYGCDVHMDMLGFGVET